MWDEHYQNDGSWFDEETPDMDELEKDVFNRERNVNRDSRGRLNKGAKLAHKDACDEMRIRFFLMQGYSVKRIVEALHCSKSTVYRIRKQYEEEKGQEDNIWGHMI